jgi:6-phosphofructokinase 1
VSEDAKAFAVRTLGPCRFPSPLRGPRFVTAGERVLWPDDWAALKACWQAGQEPPAFEMAGPRETVYFDPASLRCGIVTCGGLCPGLNDVIRAIVLGLNHHYGVRAVLGFRYGYEGLASRYGHEPLELTPDVVARIHEAGGTVLGSSRGNQDVAQMVDGLERLKVGILFAIGGDGTLRGAHAISEEAARRGAKLAVIGVPKTIDNDISYVQTSFGFETAVAEARRATQAAHAEASGGRNGIGLVKLMGRDSGFIAGYAALADPAVSFCLIPEAPFTLEGFLRALQERVQRRGQAVVVAAEGAGQDLLRATDESDASGNVRYGDIGAFLKDRIHEHFAAAGLEVNLKYIDPSYMIRSLPANARDAAFCLLLGHSAVHAGMAGRTDMVVGYWRNAFTHVPLPLAVSSRKKVDTDGFLWNSVLAATGQPRWSGPLS